MVLRINLFLRGEMVSMGLMHEDDLAKLFEGFFEVDVKISNDQMYVVSGVRR